MDKNKKRNQFFSKFIRGVIVIFFSLCGLLFVYTSSLIGVKETPKTYLNQLRSELRNQGFFPQFFVISGRRFRWDNYLLSTFGGAAKNSYHLKGQAIDIIVLDINGDGKCNGVDVDTVVRILDKKIIGNKGGIGTYKKQSGFFNRQMVHFDNRGKWARWRQ